MVSAIRVPLVEPGTRPELAAIEAAIRAERAGEVAVLYQALLNSPPVAAGWEAMLTAIRNRTALPAALRELIILRVAVLNRASFEFTAHVPHAQAAGIPGEKIEALRHWPDTAVAFSQDETLAVTLTDQMTRHVEVDAGLIERVQERFGARGTVEMVATVAAYNMVSRFLVALGIVH